MTESHYCIVLDMGKPGTRSANSKMPVKSNSQTNSRGKKGANQSQTKKTTVPVVPQPTSESPKNDNESQNTKTVRVYCIANQIRFNDC